MIAQGVVDYLLAEFYRIGFERNGEIIMWILFET